MRRKFEHRLLTNSACEPGFRRFDDTWNKRTINIIVVKKPAKNMVYGCVRHILICAGISLSSSGGIILCISERLQLFYTPMCWAVVEWKKKSENKHESHGDFTALNMSTTHLT